GEAYVTLERQASKQNPPVQGNSAAVDTLRMKLVGANATAAVAGLDRQSGVVNYFIGNDPKKWRSGIPTFGKVDYTAIYPGIDLVFYGNQQQLEYDFIVAPGADPSRIAWQIEGAALSVDRHGDLQLVAPNGPASFKRPVLYQMNGDKKVSVAGRYVIAGHQARFALGAYDHTKPLIIDPVLSYLSYLGGAVSAYGPAPSGTSYIGWSSGYSDWVQGQPTEALAVDGDGDVYVTGNTNAIDFPVKHAVQGSDAALKVNYNATSAYVTKFNPEGTGLIYSTYLSGGGQFFTKGTSIAVDAEGNAYAAGWTDDPNYPTTSGAFQRICGAFSNNGTRTANCQAAGPQNGFVTKLEPTGSKIVYSTLLGANQESLNSIAVDTEGRAYVAGVSTDWCDPTLPSFECYPTTAGAVLDGLATGAIVPGENFYTHFSGFATLSVFSADGSSLLYSTLVGDNTALIASGALSPSSYGETTGVSVAVNAAGEFFLAGSTKATKLPVTGAAYQKHGLASLPNQGATGFVAKFNPIGAQGSSLNYLTYLGANSDPNNAFAEPSGIAADDEGNAYVLGLTDSQYYPTTQGSYQPSCGTSNFDECSTAFVTKL
ncbi:MAG: SBBP repeat-containing protein, partial [Thermoplasmata archaeon]